MSDCVSACASTLPFGLGLVTAALSASLADWSGRVVARTIVFVVRALRVRKNVFISIFISIFSFIYVFI